MRFVAFHVGALLFAVATLESRRALAQAPSPESTSAVAAPATPDSAAASASPPAGSDAAAQTPAPLDVRAQCVSQHEQSQLARMRESLLVARAAALSCSQAECPALLRTDCVQWFAELDHEVPSVVISVHAGTSDVAGVTVRIDGKPLPSAFDGQLLELDPGPHLVEVLPAGQPLLSRQVVLAAGEKGRLLVFEISSTAVAAPAVPQRSAAQPTHRPVPTLTWVLSGTAVAALGVGSVFGGLALAERNKLEQKPENGGCSPYCTDAEVAPVHHRTLTADVFFGMAVASAAGAVVSYFLRPEVPLATTRLGLDIQLRPGFATFGVRGNL